MNITKVVLEADSSSIRSATKDLNALQGSGEEAQKTSAALGKAMLAVTAAVGSGIAVVTSAVRANMEFSAAISELSAITGATGKDLEFFAEQSKEIGRTTTLSASQAAQAFKLIASAKPDLLENAQALAAVTREAVLLSQAAGIQLTEAASVVGISLNQFGASADQAARFVNVLAAGAKFGSSEIAESAMALKNAGAAANAAGVSFETTNAAIQALAAGGIKAAEAGTSLRNIILILEQEQESKYRPSVVGLTQAIANMADRQLSLTELTKIFGRENVVAAQTIITQSDSLVQLERNMTGTLTATEQAAINVDNLRGDMLMLNSATEALQIEIGQRFDPAVRRATQSITEMAGSAAEFVASDRFSAWLKTAQTGAELLAVVIAARMVPAIAASAASFVIATQQAIAYQLALARMAGVSATAAASQAALSGALALVGGPAGALLLVVGGLALLISKMESATEMTARLRSQLDKLSREELTRGIAVQKTYIQGIETQIARLSKQNQSVAAVRDRMAELSIRLEEGQKDLQRLENAMRGVEDREFDKLIDDMTEGFYGYTAAAKPAVAATAALSSETQKAADAARDFVRSMDSAARASYNTESAYVQLMGATDQVTVRTTRLTTEQRSAILTNKDAQDSIDVIVEKMGKQKTASTELTQVTAMMRNDISNAFADMMMNGGNAFDNIAKSFQRMVYKMVADWAASGVMNVLSRLGGGVGGHTSTLGNIISGAGTSSIGSAVGSIIGGGSAAAASAAVGGTAGVSTVFAAGAPTAAGLTSSAIGTTAATTSAGSSGFLAAAAAPVAVFAAIAGGLMIGAKQNEKQREELKQEWLAAEASLSGMGINVNEIYSESAVRNMLEAAPEFAGLPGVDAAALSQGLISGAVRQFLFDPSSYQQMDGSNANGLDYVPFDGYRSTLHQGEAVITARGNDALGMMASALTEMRTIMAAVAQHTAKSARQLERWDFGGLPEERAFA